MHEEEKELEQIDSLSCLSGHQLPFLHTQFQKVHTYNHTLDTCVNSRVSISNDIVQCIDMKFY